MNDQKRKIRLQELIETMNSGQDVANRDMKNCLTAEEWEQYEDELASNKNMVDDMSTIPKPLKRYVELLKIADLLICRSEAMYPKGNPISRRSLEYQSQSAYERALEHLQEVIERDGSNIKFLDRSFYYSTENPSKCCGADQLLVPRLTTSLSHHANKKPKYSLHEFKRWTKLSALENSLDILVNGKPEETASLLMPTRITKKPLDTSKLNFD